jgi:hypothetical protein
VQFWDIFMNIFSASLYVTLVTVAFALVLYLFPEPDSSHIQAPRKDQISGVASERPDRVVDQLVYPKPSNATGKLPL